MQSEDSLRCIAAVDPFWQRIFPLSPKIYYERFSFDFHDRLVNNSIKVYSLLKSIFYWDETEHNQRLFYDCYYYYFLYIKSCMHTKWESEGIIWPLAFFIFVSPKDFMSVFFSRRKCDFILIIWWKKKIVAFHLCLLQQIYTDSYTMKDLSLL